jgi:uncharacterized Zn finger protein (UPF0148 family)
VPLMRITCPECGAGLKSSAGFKVGQTITCPKCETEFEVEQPAPEPVRPSKKAAPSAALKKPARPVVAAVEDDEDEDDRPRKKKKKKKRDEEAEEWSYKNSWIRYAVLGVLLVILGVLAYMLYQKQQREKENTQGPPADSGDGGELRPFEPKGVGRPNVQLNPLPPPGPPGGGAPKAAPKGAAPKGAAPKGAAPPAAGVPGIPLFGTGPAPNSAEDQQLRADLSKKLIGTWRADLGSGAVQVIEYRADGTFKDSLTRGAAGGRETSGTYRVAGLIGTRGLRLDRPIGTRNQAKAVFEGDELVHDTDDPAVSGVFYRQQ